LILDQQKPVMKIAGFLENTIKLAIEL
jgi:hypothetical protein